MLADDEPWLVRADELLRWTPAGYDARRRRTDAEVEVITPPLLVDILRSDWLGAVPLLHPSAETSLEGSPA